MSNIVDKVIVIQRKLKGHETVIHSIHQCRPYASDETIHQVGELLCKGAQEQMVKQFKEFKEAEFSYSVVEVEPYPTNDQFHLR